MAKATVLPSAPTSLIGLRLVDDDMALHLCSYMKDVVLERVYLFPSIGVWCLEADQWRSNIRCIEHSEANFKFP